MTELDASCPWCGAADVADLKQHVPPCFLLTMIEERGVDAAIDWLLRAAESRRRPPTTGATISVIESDITCRHCGHSICNLCAFNGMCQGCGVELDEATAVAFDDWWDRTQATDAR